MHLLYDISRHAEVSNSILPLHSSPESRDMVQPRFSRACLSLIFCMASAPERCSTSSRHLRHLERGALLDPALCSSWAASVSFPGPPSAPEHLRKSENHGVAVMFMLSSKQSEPASAQRPAGDSFLKAHRPHHPHRFFDFFAKAVTLNQGARRN